MLLQEDEEILTIPADSIIGLHTLSEDVVNSLSHMSIHGRIAAEVVLHRKDKVREWFDLVPPYEDFAATVPFMWDEELQQLLPREALDITKRQQSRSEEDWTLFTAGFPTVSRQDYFHAWMLVSTRAFFWETPETRPYPWQDRLAMVPVADLFNHSAEGCAAVFSEDEGYAIRADRVYQAGEQVNTSYGTHSNDYLLAEYGFLLSENVHDKICLDDFILPRLEEDHVLQLEQDEVDIGGFMYRPELDEDDMTWDVLRVLCGTNEDDDQVYELLGEILQEYMTEVKTMLAKTEGLASPQGMTIKTRWRQIQQLTQSCIDSIEDRRTQKE